MFSSAFRSEIKIQTVHFSKNTFAGSGIRIKRPDFIFAVLIAASTLLRLGDMAEQLSLSGINQSKARFGISTAE